MKLKKLIAAVSAILMAGSILVACGGNGGNAASKVDGTYTVSRPTSVPMEVTRRWPSPVCLACWMTA